MLVLILSSAEISIYQDVLIVEDKVAYNIRDKLAEAYNIYQPIENPPTDVHYPITGIVLSVLLVYTIKHLRLDGL